MFLESQLNVTRHLQNYPSSKLGLVRLANLLCRRNSCSILPRLLIPPRPFHRSSVVFSMPWSASVLSTASSDTEPTVVITFDSAKYIFNVGENTTRAFLQSRQNWKKTRALFLTSVGTQRASGLPGKNFWFQLCLVVDQLSIF